MATDDRLARFVHDALAAGRGRGDIAAALTRAGWSEREIAAALSAWADTPFTPPVPRPRPTPAPRHLFLHAVLFIAMGMVAVNMVTLLHGLIDLRLADPALGPPPGTAADGLRWAMAGLIVATPVFVWMTRHVARLAAGDDAILRSPLRKWLTYLALLVSALVLIGDAVVVLAQFLMGDLTLRFALKALAVAAVAGAVFAHYLRDAENPSRRPGRSLLLVAGAVALAVGAALVGTGGPQAARDARLDLARYDEIDQIARSLACRVPDRPAPGPLPAVLTADSLGAHCPGLPVWPDTLTDDETWAPHPYERLDDDRFRVCAAFRDAGAVATGRQHLHEGFDPLTGCITGRRGAAP